MVETFFEGEIWCGDTVIQTPRTCIIATINSKDPEVHQLLQNAFGKADEVFQNNENLSIEISVFKALKKWFKWSYMKTLVFPGV